jgi:hypothetical protein
VFALDPARAPKAQSAHTHAAAVDIVSTCEPVGGERNRTVMLDLTTLVYLRAEHAFADLLGRPAPGELISIRSILKHYRARGTRAIRSKVRRITGGINGVDRGIRDQEGQVRPCGCLSNRIGLHDDRLCAGMQRTSIPMLGYEFNEDIPMSDFQSEMNRTVQGFVSQISELARKAALETLESAFSGTPARGAGRKSAAAVTTMSPSVGRPRGGKGTKRTQADIDALAERLVSFVKSNPGLRIEQINKELGTTTKDLALPIRKLVGDGYLSTKGQKRSTTYSVGKKVWKN